MIFRSGVSQFFSLLSNPRHPRKKLKLLQECSRTQSFALFCQTAYPDSHKETFFRRMQESIVSISEYINNESDSIEFLSSPTKDDLELWDLVCSEADKD